MAILLSILRCMMSDTTGCTLETVFLTSLSPTETCTTSATNPHLKLEAHDILVTSLVTGLLSLVTVSPNVLVIVLIRCHKLWKPSNFYLLSLAVSDLVVGVLPLPLRAVHMVYSYWPLGEVVCMVWSVIDESVCSISIFNLCLVVHNRYIALTQPLQSHANPPGRGLIAGQILSTLSHVPQLTLQYTSLAALMSSAAL